MKKPFILAIILSCLSMPSFSQSKTETESDTLTNALTKVISDMFSTKVLMDIDTNFFKKSGPFYMSENPEMMIMTLVLPVTHEASKDALDRQAAKLELKVKEKGELKSGDGRTVYYRKGVTKKEGKTLFVELYSIPGDAERTILLTGFCPKEAKENHGHLIQKAAVSARLGN